MNTHEPVDAADVRAMRLRVALHGLLLSLEAAAHQTRGGDDEPVPAAWRDLAGEVGARVSACRALFVAIGRAAPAGVAAMRAAFERALSAHRAFERAIDKAEGADALLDVVAGIRGGAAAWSR